MQQLFNQIKQFLAKYRSFLLYFAIGFTGLFIDLGLFVVFVRVFHMSPYIANPISTTIGIINNFLLNAYFNFKKTDHLFARFLSFYAVGWVGILLAEVILWLFTDLWGIPVRQLLQIVSEKVAEYQVEVVKGGSLFIIALLQYTLNKQVSFRESAQKATQI